MTTNLDWVAQPNDPDLDIDVDGVTITSVVRMGHEVWIGAKGGFGGFMAADGEWFTASPGDPDARVKEINIMAGFPGENSEPYIAALVRRLEHWRDEETPLRACGAPGKWFSLIEDREKWVPLPRTTVTKKAVDD